MWITDIGDEIHYESLVDQEVDGGLDAFRQAVSRTQSGLEPIIEEYLTWLEARGEAVTEAQVSRELTRRVLAAHLSGFVTLDPDREGVPSMLKTMTYDL